MFPFTAPVPAALRGKASSLGQSEGVALTLPQVVMSAPGGPGVRHAEPNTWPRVSLSRQHSLCSQCNTPGSNASKRKGGFPASQGPVVMSGLIFIHPLLDTWTAGRVKGKKCAVVLWPCELQRLSSPRFSLTRQMASSECSHCGHLIIKAPIKTWAGLMMWHVASRSGSGSVHWHCGGSESPTQDDQQVFFSQFWLKHGSRLLENCIY